MRGIAMAIVALILLVAAFVLFLLAALWNPQPAPSRFNLIAAGLACWVLSVILSAHGLGG